jgi:ferredoxin
VKVTFVPATGEKVVVNAHVGAMLMEAARDNDIDIEAACDGTCSCSTCHMYLDAASYAKVPAPSDDELDMLDLAPEVKEGSSRLSCQVRITPELDGMVASIPAAFSNQLS